MSPDKSPQNLFNEALERKDPVERVRFLDEACGTDAALRERVEKLLRAHDEAGGFFSQPSKAPSSAQASRAMALPVTEKPGDKIGRYKLLQQIGEGGCGVVYMAEQEEPVRRRVALKVIKLGMDTKQVIARFEAERQALALMDHPNIAKVFDAGSTERPVAQASPPASSASVPPGAGTGGETPPKLAGGDAAATLSAGRPFFVMELVRGTKLTEFCDQKKLSPRERLELFIPVCQAIQHAHQKGIIHRDLKPSNILVTIVDGKPVSKVIDFGIAKATNNQRLTDLTVFTAFEQFIGTPAYMSPEQAELSGVDIDTRTDIYSLGVVLYELLTGKTPFDPEQFLRRGIDEIRRTIREQEPPKPSTRLHALSQADLTTTAQARQTDAPKLIHQVRGDLDWIVMKCLEKERDRRYETANGLAMDVQRYLADEPVVACPPSAAYRLTKFVRRNKGSMAIAALMLCFLVLMGSGIGWAIRDRTARQARVAGQVEMILSEVDQLESEQKWSEALSAARRAEAAVNVGEADAESVQQVRARLLDMEFIDRLEQIRMLRATWVESNFDNAATDREYARAFREYGVDVEMLTVETSISRLKARPALAIPLAAALDDWHYTRLFSNDAAGAKRREDIARGIDPDPLRDRLRSIRGEPASEAGDELCRLAGSIDIRARHPATLERLARELRLLNHPDAALRLLQDAQHFYPGDFWLNFDLAQLLENREDFAGAIRFYTAAVSIRPHAIAAINNLGAALRGQNKLNEALAAYRKSIELDPKFAYGYYNVGRALQEQKQLDEAIIAYRKAIELDPKDARTHYNVGTVLQEQKKLDEAVIAYRKAIELNPRHAGANYNVGRALQEQKKLDEAIFAYRKAIELNPNAAGAYVNLGSALAEQKKLPEAVAAFHKAIELDPEYALAYYNLGDALNEQGKLDLAITALRKAIELDLEYARAYMNLGVVLRKQGKSDEAIAAYRKAIELDPKDAKPHNNLGAILCDVLRDYEGAATCFRKAIELDPEFAPAYGNLGKALWHQGKLSEAIAANKKALALDPEFATHYNRLAWYLATCADARLRDPGQAVSLAEKAVEIDPKDPDIPNTLGVAYYRIGDWKATITALEKSMELRNGGDPADWVFLAMAHWQLGNKADARQWYGKSVEWMEKNEPAPGEMNRFRKEAAELLGVTDAILR